MEIIHRDGDKMNCGFLGLRVMFHVLSDYGEAELAYRMITGPSYPSYGYFRRSRRDLHAGNDPVRHEI